MQKEQRTDFVEWDTVLQYFTRRGRPKKVYGSQSKALESVVEEETPVKESEELPATTA
jgi:hypothetical protein